MANKPKIDKWERQHRRNVAEYERLIDAVYSEAAKEAAFLSTLVGGISGDKPFSFADYPITHSRVKELLGSLNNSIYAVIVNGVRSEWALSNDKNNELCNQVFGAVVGRLSEAQRRRYYSTNEKAREEFIARKHNGLNLSDRVWNYTNQFKDEIEMGLDIGLREGLSAVDMARNLKQYLRYPDKLFRRVRDEHGELHLSKAAKAFHPGQGVYRSSYKNARRLAATETNIAYRTSDYDRWQNLDFVVGIEIHLSNNHTLNGEPFKDICDKLKGRYPKDFKFAGWHPLCRCFATSILKTREELFADNERIMRGEEPLQKSANTVPDVPDEFKEWLQDNEDRIAKAKSLPYFMIDNNQYLNQDVFEEFLDDNIAQVVHRARQVGGNVQNIAESVAHKYGAVCTPINYKSAASIKRKVMLERQNPKTPNFMPAQLKDTVRTTIIGDSDKLDDIKRDLEKDVRCIGKKRQNNPLGYKGYIANFRMKNGLTAEIQVNTPKMIYAKEPPESAKMILGEDVWHKIRKETGMEGGLGHKYYKQYRVLNPDNPKAKEILKKSVDYYSHFI